VTPANFSVFFAMLCLTCWAGTSAVVVLLLIRRVKPASEAGAALEGVGAGALWLGWLVAAVATAGSLYYSEVAHFVPCELCWYQRICMYPLSAILLVAAIRQDRHVWRYAMPLAAVGAVIAVYHTQLQAFPAQHSFCSTLNPCTTRYVWEFGFVSLPFMALTGFCFVMAMLFVARLTDPGPLPVHGGGGAGSETEWTDADSALETETMAAS